MFGEAKDNSVLLRSGARVGDEVFVSGYIGDAFLGLSILQEETVDSYNETHRYLINRFRKPSPRLELGEKLIGIATSAIDVSDGLISDLGHVCSASMVSANILFDKVPVSKAAKLTAFENENIRKSLITAGDDYELIFTVPSNRSGIVKNLSLELGINLTKIGNIVNNKNSQLVSAFDLDGNIISLDRTGFRHF